MSEMCGEVLGHIGDDQRVIGKRGKMRCIIAVPPPRVHVLMDLLVCPPPLDQSLALVKCVGSVWRLWVSLIEILLEVQVFVTLL